MNSLMNYGSDDDYDDSSEEKQTDWRGTSSRDKQSSSKQTDANYEEVQMDLSEESNDSKPEAKEAARRSRERDRSRHDRDDHRRRDDRSSRDKDGKSRSEKDDRHNHRRDRDRKSRRSSSRDRRRSRSPRRSDREPKHSRSRSRSRDRSGRKHSKRHERPGAKTGQPDKLDAQKPESEEKRNAPSETDRFFMPGITGRFRDQIERRKQLWQKKDSEQKDNKNGQSKKVWETTTFAQDADGKVANKFKRLMGIRGSTEAAGQAVDVLKKQEEMFSSMEQQYEVARTATHTMRGVGLGFGSYQR